MGLKERTLVYRRAEWFGTSSSGQSFEFYLRAALERLPNIEDTRVERDDGLTAEVRHYHLGRSSGTHVHIAGYTPRDRASIVPLAEGVRQADLSTVRAPSGSEFWDGDLMLRANADHVVICPSNLRERFAIHFIRNLFQRAGFEDAAKDFDLIRIANIDKARMIAESGVSKIALDVGLYDATAEQLERHQIDRMIGGPVLDWLMQMAGEDPTSEEIRSAENLQAKLVISFDRRRKGGTLERERMERVAERLVRDEEEGVSIVTPQGTIGLNQISMTKPVSFESFGKTISHTDAWSAIDRYFAELSSIGALEQ